MALNKLLKEKNSINLALTVGLLSKFNKIISSSLTEKERISAESEFINRMKRAHVYKLEDEQVSFKSKLDDSSYSRIKTNLKYDTFCNYIIMNTVTQNYMQSINEIVFLSETIENKIRKIEQKRLVLEGWDKAKNKFYILEKFIFLDKINFVNSNNKNLSINSFNGQVTLPIVGESTISIKEISIKSGNGNAGNSDSEVTLNNMNLKNIIDGNPDSWFEYEKLDSGPVNLKLKVLFESSNIINKFSIEGFFDQGNDFDIEDIILINDYEKKSVKNDFKDKSLMSKMFNLNGANSSGEYSFIPFLTKYAIIILKSNSFERLENFRKRFSIAIKSLSFKKVKYESNGSLYSNEYKLISNLNLVKPEISGIKTKGEFSSTAFSYTFDDGENWHSSEDMNVVPLDAKKIEWKLVVQRDADAFRYLNSFENKEYQYEYKSYSFPKGKGRREIALARKKISKEVFGLEVGFGIRSENRYSRLTQVDSFRFIKSDDSYENESEYKKIELPINLHDQGILPYDLAIKINNIDCTYYDSLAQVIANENSFCVSDDQEHILINGNLQRRNSVKWRVVPDEVEVSEDSRFYYFKFSSYFNPDFDLIKLRHLSDERRVKKEKIDGSRSIFKLKEKNILKDSISVVDSSGSSLERVSLSSSLASGKFYFDEKSRILKLFWNPNNINYTVSYEYEKEALIDSKHFNLWFEQEHPVGIKINKEHINAKKYQVNLLENSKKYSLAYGTYQNVNNASNSKKFFVGSKGVVGNSIRILNKEKMKEVDYIDGESEFQRIYLIEDEETNAIESSSNNIISFKVSAREKILLATGVFFENNNFFTEESASLSSEGQWKILSDGTIQVYAPNGIPQGIKYSYYYTSGEKLYNKYSFDKKNGYLYFSEVQNGNEIDIEYKVIDAAAEYQIAKKIKVNKVNQNRLSLNTDLLYNRLGEVRIFFRKDSNDENLLSYREYYSPIIHSVGFRFK